MNTTLVFFGFPLSQGCRQLMQHPHHTQLIRCCSAAVAAPAISSCIHNACITNEGYVGCRVSKGLCFAGCPPPLPRGMPYPLPSHCPNCFGYLSGVQRTIQGVSQREFPHSCLLLSWFDFDGGLLLRPQAANCCCCDVVPGSFSCWSTRLLFALPC